MACETKFARTSARVDMKIRMGFIGFGNVGREFARLVLERGTALERQTGARLVVTGIHTRTRGTLIEERGVDLAGALRSVQRDGHLPSGGAGAPRDASSFILECPADVIVEMTPLNVESGEPAATHVEMALRAGRHVVTANKGPVAWHYHRLEALSREVGRRFLFESAVMDGAPVFNLVRHCLRGCSITGFTGILNSTTNFILDRTGAGDTFEQALAKAQALGIAEADPTLDIDGWDAAAKTAALMNVLMDARVTPRDIRREGIRSAARHHGLLRLICRGGRDGGSVRLEPLPSGHPLAAITGTSSVIVLHTDMMGDLAIVEKDPGLTQTAYGVLADVLEIASCEPLPTP